MPKVTVAMASYNHERFVGEAIESVLAQDGCDFDFIIVDDGSKDRTAEVIKEYKDPRIHFLPVEKNQGACVALRRAIEGGKGEYVAILNSDDGFLPGKLKKQVDYLNRHPDIYAVFGQPRFIDEKGKSLRDKEHFCGQVFRQPNRTRQEWLNHFFYKYNALCHPTVMLRRECYHTLGYYDPRLAQTPDFDFWIRLTQQYDIHLMPEELIKYRILAGERNMSAPNPSSCYRTHWEMLHCIRNYLQIKTIEDFIAKFPDEKANVLVPDNDLVPYYLAKLAIRASVDVKSVHHLFGLETLHSMLQNSEMKAKLERTLGFTYADFIELSGARSIFAVTPPRSFCRRLWDFGKKLTLAAKMKLQG